MKNFKTTLLITLLLCFALNLAQAQQRYQIHQDNVRPASISEYEKIAKEFVEACKEHNPQTSWVTASTNDLRYLYITPMENFADLDNNVFADMATAMGDDFGDMFSRFDKCYDSHSDYVITLSESLTFMPEGISQTQEGQNHRKWYYIYYKPENSKAVYDAMKSIKDMFAEKGSKEYYRVYRSGFGSAENFLVVAISSKDEIDAATRSKANNELLGESAGETFGKLMGSILRMEEYSGNMRPDLAYKSTD